MTWAAIQTVDATHSHYNDSLCFDDNEDRALSTYFGSSSTVMHYRVLQIESDDTLTVGSEGTIGSSAEPLGMEMGCSVVFDPDTDNVVAIYKQSNRHYIVGGEITGGSTNTVAWGTAVALDVWYGNRQDYNTGTNGYLMTVDTAANKIVCIGAIGGTYTYGNTSLGQADGKVLAGVGGYRVNGVITASIASDKPITVDNVEPMLLHNTNNWGSIVQEGGDRGMLLDFHLRGMAYDVSTERCYVLANWDFGGLGNGPFGWNMTLGVCKVIKSPYRPPSWVGDMGFPVGFATTGVNNGESVTVTVAGGTNENQQSLTVGSRYLIFDDGILRKPADLVNKTLTTSSIHNGQMTDITQWPMAGSIWKYDVGFASDTDKLMVNIHGGMQPR